MINNAKQLTGYRRPNGRVGIRNHLLVIPTVGCANVVVESLARHFGTSIMTVTHPYGCTFDTVSNEETTDTIAGFAANPNVGAVLLIGLGCESVSIDRVYNHVKANGTIVEKLVIQEAGGTVKTTEKAIGIISSMQEQLALMEREPIDLSELIIGLECGSSDSYSGLSVNPALGMTSDLIVAGGGTVILTELTEFIGAEDLLYQQSASPEIASKLKHYLDETERNLSRVDNNGELLDIAPGNIQGGLTTLEEKSLGCVKKGGTTPVRQIVGHGEIPSEHGLVIMDASGHDVESLIALAAGGCQLIFFSTGRGTPTGNPIVPVIKASSNDYIYEHMADNIDISCGTVISGEETIEQAGERLFDLMLDVVNGNETKSEIHHSVDFAIRRRGVGVCIL